MSNIDRRAGPARRAGALIVPDCPPVEAFHSVYGVPAVLAGCFGSLDHYRLRGTFIGKESAAFAMIWLPIGDIPADVGQSPVTAQFFGRLLSQRPKLHTVKYLLSTKSCRGIRYIQ
jgi:hypothetical protein